MLRPQLLPQPDGLVHMLVILARLKVADVQLFAQKGFLPLAWRVAFVSDSYV